MLVFPDPETEGVSVSGDAQMTKSSGRAGPQDGSGKLRKLVRPVMSMIPKCRRQHIPGNLGPIFLIRGKATETRKVVMSSSTDGWVGRRLGVGGTPLLDVGHPLGTIFKIGP
jgi:hypothetical protein